MLSIQKSPTDKTGLGYVPSSSDAPSSSKTVFVKPTVSEPPPTVEDKGKDKVSRNSGASFHHKTSYMPPL
jgi:hypothetical protein